MSGYILCQVKRASMPYYIENISMNIYSIEELCYYLRNNMYLLDETIIGEHLCDWLKQELGLERLYRKLYKILSDGGSTGDFILAVFKEINYLSHNEFRELNAEIQLLEQQPEPVRMKKKGDYLVENKMYVSAVRVYEETLETEDAKEMGVPFSGSIYHNMGCAYLHLFQMKDALFCFRKAYEKLHTKQALKDYLTVCYLFDGGKSWEVVCDEMGVDQRTREEVIEEVQESKENHPKRSKEEIEDFLLKLTKDYHRSTGF